MNLQPSTSFLYNDRRVLFAYELATGGHGQTYLSGAGTYTPTPGYVFYQIDFLESTNVSSVVFRTVNDNGDVIYDADNAEFTQVTFPAGYTWNAPLTSITLTDGSAIAYEYRVFAVDGDGQAIFCSSCQ